MKPGDTVAVRDFEGKTLRRRVASVRGDVLLVCTDEEYTTAKREKRSPVSVGFKMAYVVARRNRRPRLDRSGTPKFDGK